MFYRVVVQPGEPPTGPHIGYSVGTLDIGLLIRIKLNTAEIYFKKLHYWS